MINSFKNAIKLEQRRIQRLIDLSEEKCTSHGSLQLRRQGDRIYAYERWQGKDVPIHKAYLGPVDSERVREHFSMRFQAQRLARLCHDQKLLQGRGVLFRYECEIEIVDKSGRVKKLYPDFLIQCFDGTFIIIEHLGKMGEYGYAMDFGEKSYYYFQEGFVLGKNYFVTSDDQNYGTDSQMIARFADRIEEMFYGF